MIEQTLKDKLYQSSQQQFHYHFMTACSNLESELIDYILTNKDFESKLDIHIFNDLAFKTIMNDNELVHRFIFEYNIAKTEYISKVIKDKSSIIDMFALRELNEQLHKKLPISSVHTKLPKV